MKHKYQIALLDLEIVSDKIANLILILFYLFVIISETMILSILVSDWKIKKLDSLQSGNMTQGKTLLSKEIKNNRANSRNYNKTGKKNRKNLVK